MRRLSATAAGFALAAAGIVGAVDPASAAAAAPAAAATTTTATTTARSAPAAPSAPCEGVRYASTTNVIYLTAAKTYTPASIAAACPGAPITKVSGTTWLLSADIVVEPGATLALHGSSAGGDTDTLRIRSRSSNARTEVQSITALGSTIDARNVTVTSWNDQAGEPDTTPAYVSSSQRGRAFVRAISYTDSGTTRQATMNIVSSTFEHLGYYAAESYGVAYKSRQCGRENPANCANGPVTGVQRNSTFRDNYMGTYLWGARDMEITGNTYTDSVMYGLNGHDGTARLTVSGNRFEKNGNHGFICSQACDRLTVTDNVSTGNGRVPWSGPDPENEIAGQVHGMMLHRGVTNTVVANNRVSNNPNGAGIAIFDVEGVTVRDNTVDGAKYGLRVSVGARGNTFRGNTVSNSGEYAVFSYAGTDKAQYTNASGRPSGNRFVGNVINGSGSSVIKLNDSDAYVFESNDVTATTPIELTRSARAVFEGNDLPSGQQFRLRGNGEYRTSVTISPSAGVKIDRDQYSTATLR